MTELRQLNGATILASEQTQEASLGQPQTAADCQTPAAPLALTPQERRRQRIALVEEFGGAYADLKKAAQEAIQRGMYSPRTNRGDIESSLLRTWKHRHRNYQR